MTMIDSRTSLALVLVLASTSLFADDATQDRPTRHYFRVSGGLFFDSDLYKIVGGNLGIDERHAGIFGLEYGFGMWQGIGGWPIDVAVKIGLIRHFERDLQEDFNQYTASIKLYFHGFPWSDRFHTRFGIAEGLSYASKIPYIERESLERRQRETSNLLNYLDLTLDVDIGDVFPAPRLKNCFAGIGITHRSGIFGAEVFNGVDGGSNYGVISLECVRW